MSLFTTGTSELSVQKAKAEITRLIKEELIRLVSHSFVYFFSIYFSFYLVFVVVFRDHQIYVLTTDVSFGSGPGDN